MKPTHEDYVRNYPDGSYDIEPDHEPLPGIGRIFAQLMLTIALVAFIAYMVSL